MGVLGVLSIWAPAAPVLATGVLSQDPSSLWRLERGSPWPPPRPICHEWSRHAEQEVTASAQNWEKGAHLDFLLGRIQIGGRGQEALALGEVGKLPDGCLCLRGWRPCKWDYGGEPPRKALLPCFLPAPADGDMHHGGGPASTTPLRAPTSAPAVPPPHPPCTHSMPPPPPRHGRPRRLRSQETMADHSIDRAASPSQASCSVD